MKKIDVWVLVTWLALIGQIGSLIYSYDGNFALLETGFGLLQLMLIIASAIHVYVAFAVASNFDRIEAAIAKLESGKEIKEANNSQMDNPIEESIREGEKDSESSNAEKLQEE